MSFRERGINAASQSDPVASPLVMPRTGWLYSAVLDHIRRLFPQGGMVQHLERTAAWVVTLKPDADEALLVAALLHDLERAYKSERPPRIRGAATRPDCSVQSAYMRFHQEEGARLGEEVLTGLGADSMVVARVRSLVAHHEDGGTPDADVLQAADSLSFFEGSIDHFLEVFLPARGFDSIRLKFQYMYTRIVVPRAREIAKPMYESAMRRLAELKT